MVNYCTFLFLWVLVLGLNQKLFESSVSFEMGLYTIFAAYIFDALPQALNVWDDHMSHTGSSPGGVCLLILVAGGAGFLCCGTNMVIVISTTLPSCHLLFCFVLY